MFNEEDKQQYLEIPEDTRKQLEEEMLLLFQDLEHEHWLTFLVRLHQFFTKTINKLKKPKEQMIGGDKLIPFVIIILNNIFLNNPTLFQNQNIDFFKKKYAQLIIFSNSFPGGEISCYATHLYTGIFALKQIQEDKAASVQIDCFKNPDFIKFAKALIEIASRSEKGFEFVKALAEISSRSDGVVNFAWAFASLYDKTVSTEIDIVNQAKANKAIEHYCQAMPVRKMAIREYIVNLNSGCNNTNIIFTSHQDFFVSAYSVGAEKLEKMPSLFSKFFGGFTKEQNEKQMTWYKQKFALILEGYVSGQKTEAQLSFELSKWIKKNEPGFISGLFNKDRKEFFKEVKVFAEKFKTASKIVNPEETIAIEEIENKLKEKMESELKRRFATGTVQLKVLLENQPMPHNVKFTTADEDKKISQDKLPQLARQIYGLRKIDFLAQKHPGAIEHTPAARRKFSFSSAQSG